MPTISVIIPCYNDGEYITDAIETALKQTVTPDEILVVDDGSTEDIRAVISEYLDEGNVDYIKHNRNKGLPAARNTGIQNSTGEYIALLDADDLWLPNKLEHQIAVLNDSEELGMVYSYFHQMTLDGEKIRTITPLDAPNNQFLEKLFVKGGSILPSTVVIRRTCLNDVGLFDERLKLAQERELWLRIGAEYPVKRIEMPLVKRRVRPDSLASDYEEKYTYEQITTEKMLNLYPSLENLVDQREAHLLYNRASYRLRQGDSAGARADAIDALRLDSHVLDAYAVVIVSLLWGRLPQRAWSILSTMKSMKSFVR